MQTLILNHYPPAIKKIKEIEQIAKAEDIEFSKLNTSIDKVIKNMFILTADETGIQKFEKMLGIKPKASQSLNDRRVYILFMMNRYKMSLPEIMVMLSDYYASDVTLKTNYETYELIVDIGENIGNTGMLYKVLDELMPMQVYICFSAEITAKIEILETSKGLELETTAYWWNGAPDRYFYDGTIFYDGKHMFNTIAWQQLAELVLQTSVKMTESFDRISTDLETYAEMKQFETEKNLEFETTNCCYQKIEDLCQELKTTITIKEEFKDLELTAQKDLYFFDGSALYDGSRLYDAEIYEEVL